MAAFDDDEGPWTAYYVDPLNCPAALVNYVYHPKRRVAAFRFLASLCLLLTAGHSRLTMRVDIQILHDIIVELYSSESALNPRQRMGFIAQARQRLGNMWKSVPDTMKFNPTQPPPPPWIFMLQ
ncbi:uncharacterized protein PG986_007352 [Apiospora aurea]|uniref:Uncharacterized protein n=1 Tax=Apiospora aurea TaxID=335848 RepID=A0ABR1QCB9_9PEZI